MLVYIVDDEKLILNDEMEIIRSCLPNEKIVGFERGVDFLNAMRKEPCDIAFLDINLMDITGVRIAEIIKRDHPKVNIIFVTAYDNYFKNAMELHASGYLLKPIVKKDVERELKDLRYLVQEGPAYKLKVYCFGNFDVRTMNNEVVHFERSKSKEAFAYLIHLHGRPCTIRELAAALFEDAPFDHKAQLYIQKILSSMMRNLREYDCEDLIEKNFNSMAVKPELIECDYFKYLESSKNAQYTRPEEYMEQYSWALY